MQDEYLKKIMDLLIGDTNESKYNILKSSLENYQSMIETNKLLIEKLLKSNIDVKVNDSYFKIYFNDNLYGIQYLRIIHENNVIELDIIYENSITVKILRDYELSFMLNEIFLSKNINTFLDKISQDDLY